MKQLFSSDYCLKNHHLTISFLAFVLFLMFVSTSYVFAQDSGKTVGIRNAGEFEFSMTASKQSYKINEPIRFKVKGNKTFFLYVYAIDREKNQAVLLIPGSKQSGNKYNPGREYVVPNSPLEFFSDRAGTEEIVAVASTSYIDVKTKNYKKLGGFMSTSSKEVDHQMKTLRIQATKKKKKEQIFKQLSVNITGSTTSIALASSVSSAGTPIPIIFTSVDNSVYQLGDVVRAAFGADNPGFINIYTVEPTGNVSLLKTQQVDGKKIYTLKALAKKPAGTHALVAIFSAKKAWKGNTKSVSMLLKKSQSKSLSLIEEDTSPYSFVEFDIQK